MWLLNVATLALEEFVGEVDHPYAILSHTWEADEVSFADYVAQNCQHKSGYEKIKGFRQLAESEGFQYAWLDTCCIDKTSSAELFEAINSMFQWYRDAAVCLILPTCDPARAGP
ncbi:heterokaryon incompatibility protein-domain-containing protein [Thelonectria olida]|uniref:Heterokaryon incompatibility protein-domain-containing protein n=1 Tax=Thelonectria olida TaxID=1576542 RepID=A0A9P9APS5_9HYPO|nr:heterokaryon incompatibility protein-domain-containing protein [Thelonectria olida]